MTMNRTAAIEAYHKGFSGPGPLPVPNARSGFLESGASEVFDLHEEYHAIGRTIAEWNVGTWVVTCGRYNGVFYGKMDAVRAMGPLRLQPRVEFADSETHATALLNPSHPVRRLP